MAKPARPSHEVEEIRKRILNCSLDIIVDEGYDKLSMRKIAARSGMSATNLYYYFSKKDEIYLSIIILGFKQLHGSFDAVFQNTPTVRERARKLIRAYVTFATTHSHYYEIMFSRPAPRYREYIGTPFEKLAAIEMDYSMRIIDMAEETVAQLLGVERSEKTLIKQKVMEILSLLHGMISLSQSQIAEYMIDDMEDFIDTLIKNLIPGDK